MHTRGPRIITSSMRACPECVCMRRGDVRIQQSNGECFVGNLCVCVCVWGGGGGGLEKVEIKIGLSACPLYRVVSVVLFKAGCMH